METKTETTDIIIKNLAYEESTEQQIDSDITLPEYFSDVVRVLKCTLVPNITSLNQNDNKITVDGNAVISVLYISEDGKIHCFEQKIPFSKMIESSKIENCTCFANVKTQYVNCRVVSQRRIDIKGSISVNVKAYMRYNKKIISSCSGAGIQLRKQSCVVSNIIDCVSRFFSMKETIEIGSTQGTIGQIIRSEAVAVIDSTKLVMGKILIKGELKVKVIYLTEGECTLQKIENSMPINQIVEAQTSEDSTDFITLNVYGIEVHAKTDTSGALRLVDISAVIGADIYVYEDDNITYVTDAYSTEYETTHKKESVVIKNISERFSDTHLCKGVVESGTEKIKSIEDICCYGYNYSSEIENGEIKIFGTADIGFLIINNENEWQTFEKQLKFEYKRAVSTSENSCELQNSVVVTGMDYILSAENKIDVRMEMEITGLVFNYSENEMISDIVCDENKEKQKHSAALTIFFADEGDDVWEIARKYNTTVEMIMSENKLTSDLVSQKSKLYIPTV